MQPFKISANGLEDEPDLHARLADPAKPRESREIVAGHRAEQRTPGEQDRQPIRESGELAGSVLQREPAEKCIGTRSPGSLAQVVGDRVDADEQEVGLRPRHAADERSVSGAEVDVDGPELTGHLIQSSTVDPALLLAFDEDHALRIAPAAPLRQLGQRSSIKSRAVSSGAAGPFS